MIESLQTLSAHAAQHGYAAIATVQLNKQRGHNRKVVTPDMIEECPRLSDYAHNFIGISSLAPEDPNEAVRSSNASDQYLNVAKSAHSQGGLVPVKQQFEFQRFATSAVSSW